MDLSGIGLLPLTIVGGGSGLTFLLSFWSFPHVRNSIFHLILFIPCLHPFQSHALLPWTSELKADDSPVKGTKPKDKARDKAKSSKDKKKSQAGEGQDRRPTKPRVDELLVSDCSVKPF